MHPPTRILLILSILLSLLPIGRIIGQGPEYKQDIRDWNASVTIGAGELHRILLPVVHARWRMTEVSVSPYVPRFGLALTQGFLPIHKPGSGKLLGNLQITASWTHSSDDFRFWYFPETIQPVDQDKVSVMPGMRMYFLKRFYAGASFGGALKFIKDNGNLRLFFVDGRPDFAISGEVFFGVSIFPTVNPGP